VGKIYTALLGVQEQDYIIYTDRHHIFDVGGSEDRTGLVKE
jgi:hypothetical protein